MVTRMYESIVCGHLTLIAVLLGNVIGVVYITSYDSKQGILVGVMIGLSVCGLYSDSKILV